jgi:ubiquinone/menaquinone biosynthesis C-methylase UbiE
MANSEPTSGVVQFVDYLKKHNVASTGRAIDMGAGKCRNAIYLATTGYEAFALEYIEPALEVGKQLAVARGVENKVHFVAAEMDRRWEFDDNFFAVAIDSFSSIDIETREGREICRDEMFRTLMPGGYALVNVVSADDEWEKELIAEHPGPEPNSTLWPQNGKFQKDYDEQELREFYVKFEIIELKKASKPAHKLGRDGTATNLWAVLRKPDTHLQSL